MYLWPRVLQLEDTWGTSSAIKCVPVGLAQVVSGDANANIVEEELKQFIDNSWQWKARKVAQDEFLVMFPNQMILNAFSKGMLMVMNRIKVSISKTNMDTEASSVLQTGWITMSEIPDVARTKEAFKLIAELVGVGGNCN